MKLSVFVVTYNQEKYISQCLDSILMQKTDFEFEVVIGEDNGTDKTLEICQEYAKKYNNIRLLPSLNENIGITRNWKRVLSECKGEYIALCEGDDFWTDKNKLQKQVEFLDNHSDYTICYHYVKRKYEGIKSKDKIFPEKKFIANRDTITLNELLHQNVIQTNSVVYRNLFGTKLKVDDIPDDIMMCDYFIELLHAKYGKIGFIPEIMATYRRHKEAVWLPEKTVEYWEQIVNYATSLKQIFVDECYLQIFDGIIKSSYTEVLYNQTNKGKEFDFVEYVKQNPDQASLLVSVLQQAFWETQNSSSFRLGYFLLTPFRFIKRLLKKK